MRKLWNMIPKPVRKLIGWSIPVLMGLIAFALQDTIVGQKVKAGVNWFVGLFSRVSEGVSGAGGGVPENPPEV